MLVVSSGKLRTVSQAQLALIGLLTVWILFFGSANTLAADIQAETIRVDSHDTGRRFDGIGAVSAGGSARLLYDYPEPERSEILDYLFKPAYGAEMQLLKVEIGSDTNATDGSEPSHMRSRTDRSCSRGYEWWLMKEAKKRNPNIRLIGLSWGAPGWFRGGFWSQDNIEYIMSWLDCATENGLSIDYIGGWNERGYDSNWYIALDRALTSRYPNVQIIGADEDTGNIRWDIAKQMTTNPPLKDAVDIVGVHFACGHRTTYEDCVSPPEAQGLAKPLWMSENSALSHDVGGAPIARALNRMYIDAKMTGYMAWSIISGWYANLPLADTGLILVEWPWSGYYEIGQGIWVFAHTTQFVKPGWHYLDNSSGRLSSGATYVSFAPPTADAFSTVIETMDTSQPTSVRLQINDELKSQPIHLWSTNVKTEDSAQHYVYAGVLQPKDGELQLTLEPGHVYTLTTTKGQGKGTTKPQANINQQMQLPYRENFEQLPNGVLARYFSDLNGGFEAVSCTSGRTGTCYRQQLTQKPTQWNESGQMDPTTIFGDPRWWGDYTISAKFLLEEGGYAELLGRVSGQPAMNAGINGYHLRVTSTGYWSLYTEDTHTGKQTLASGSSSVSMGTWHDMSLKMLGSDISVLIDNKVVSTVQNTQQLTGNVALRTSWNHVQFDDVEIVPTAPAPHFLPKQQIRITSSSEHLEFYRGYSYVATNAIDDRPESLWHTAFNPRVPLPQSLTLDLGKNHQVTSLYVQPRLGSESNGLVTRYNIYSSVDGSNYTKVATGYWPVSKVMKRAQIPGGTFARYIRFEVTQGANGDMGAVGEINIEIAE